MSEASQTERSLRILHVFRSPVGGLFRHVVDLAREQVRQGHAVGLVVDSSTGGIQADRVLAGLKPDLALGLARFPMKRDPHPFDALGLARVARLVGQTAPDVVHGHGSKGALYARLVPRPRRRPRPFARVYTPHGGSLHYAPDSLKGRLVLGTERLLTRRTDLILFESAYAAERFRAAVGPAAGLTRVVLNGVAPGEFAPVPEQPGAADFLYVGELRLLKGVDVFLRALASLRATWRGTPPGALIVGAGPDREGFEELAGALGLSEAVRFAGPLPAREAFAQGRILVVPSRAESLPYIVLEAAAAARPLLATRVGGIPEILGPGSHLLVPPDDAEALSRAMAGLLSQAPETRARAAARLAEQVAAGFSVEHMVDGIMAAYRDALALGARDAARPSGAAFLPMSRLGSWDSRA